MTLVIFNGALCEGRGESITDHITFILSDLSLLIKQSCKTLSVSCFYQLIVWQIYIVEFLGLESKQIQA